MQAVLFVVLLTEAQKVPPASAAQGSQALNAALGARQEQGADGMGPEERQALYDAVVQEMIKVSFAAPVCGRSARQLWAGTAE